MVSYTVNLLRSSMKIALLGNLPKPLDNSLHRGIERFNSNLAQELAKLGHEVTVFTNTPHENNCEVKPLLCSSEASKVFKLHENDSQEFAKIARRAYLAALKEIESKKFEIIHNNSLDTLPLLASSTLSIPMLTGLHSEPTPKQKYLFEYQTYRPDSFYCATSTHTKKAWKETFPDIDVAVVESGTLKLEESVELNLSNKIQGGVWLGTIKDQCGLKETLEACQLAGVKIKIFGEIESESYFTNEVGPLLSRDACFHGRIDSKSIKRHLKNSRFAIVGPGLKREWLLDLLSNGLPILGMVNPHLQELINSSNGKLWSKLDPLEMSKTIASTKELCRVKIQQNAIKKWNTAVMARKYEKVYNFLKEIHDRKAKEKAYWYLYTSSKQRTLV